MWLAKDCALYRDQVLQKENPLRNVVGTVPAVCECIPLLAHCTHIVRPCGVLYHAFHCLHTYNTARPIWAAVWTT